MSSGQESAYPSVGAYALLSDAHSAALVSRDGSVDWCCFHRFDARPVFARILDWSRGGYFRIAPTHPYTATRRYLPGTNILETRFAVGRSALVLVDCLPVRPAAREAPSHLLQPYHQLLRLIRSEAGEVEVGVEFVPRFDYGLTVPRLEWRDDAVIIAYGGADALVLQSQLALRRAGVGDAHGVILLRAPQEAFVAVTYAQPHELRVQRLEMEQVRERIEITGQFWTDWSARCTYHGPYRDAVVRSALALKAMTNAPTGAIVASPTTSLPERIGGARNWDYRFTWLRDAALTIYALFTLGYREEAHAFMRWLKRTTAGRAEDLQIMYGVGGERLLPEVELPWLEGYRGSRPVRIGNDASRQFQLDAYGYLLDTAWLYHRHGGDIDSVFWELLQGVVAHVEAQWEKPDCGIWEVRGAPRHFLSSKVLAWVAVDRAIRLARALRLPADLPRWRHLHGQIRRRIEANGVDPARGVFVQAFGSTALDASTLLIPLVRFLRPDDPRVQATARAIERELSVDGLVYRYREDDALPGGEGAFVICTWWLVDNLALVGDLRSARALFERLLGRASDVGLLAEQIDPETGELLGNFPQGFSHVGLIGAAMNLQRARRLRERG